MPDPRIDPIFYVDDAVVVLRIRGDDGVETTIEWSWEETMDRGVRAAPRDDEADGALTHHLDDDDA